MNVLSDEVKLKIQARIDQLGVDAYWRSVQLLRCELAVAFTVEQLELVEGDRSLTFQ